MKKTYINPNIHVVMMKMNQHLLESSPGSQLLDRSTPQIDNSNDIGARGFDFGYGDEE